jgi:DNA-binding NarL/FixJ family response regulator
MVSVMLVDDQVMVRRALHWELELEPDLKIVGEANTGAAGVALAQQLHPDMVIMDVEMPVMDGLQAARRLHEMAPDCVIMLLSINDGADLHDRALAAGARIFLVKGNPALFRMSVHDLVQYVKARSAPSWPENGAAGAELDKGKDPGDAQANTS